MSDVAISVEGIGKRYTIGTGPKSPYGSIRESLAQSASAPFRRLRGPVKEKTSTEFWALKDVSFEVKHGEAIGIIGRNGAGKSTLLKVLSRITEPTTGRAVVYGRVGSLLEVGTGFHPELTGRENIYLNGAVMGMTKRDISAHFDEIVDFAGVEQHLDTPVKRYSSGMYMRLAFAVAAHLESDVLIVDEVLAVGDMSFQKKCLNKMEEVGKTGRAVLFVSHNMPSVTRLCERVVLLENGLIVADGSSQSVISRYLSVGVNSMAAREWPDIKHAPGNAVARLRSVRVCLEDGKTAASIDIRKPVGIEMRYDVLKSGVVLASNYHVFNEEGQCVFIAVDQHNKEWSHIERQAGSYLTTAWIPANFLAEGTFMVGAALSTLNPVEVHYYEADAVAFQVVDSLDGTSARGSFAGTMPGIVRPLLDWVTIDLTLNPPSAIEAALT